MDTRGAVKKSSLAVRLSKSALVVLVILALLIGLDELSAQGDSEYRRTIWDRITGEPEPPKGRAAVSIQLAQEMCRQEVARQLGDMLVNASFDDRSSRYNQEHQVHTVFLDLSVASNEPDVYARCEVSAVRRVILEYRIKGWGNPFWG